VWLPADRVRARRQAAASPATAAPPDVIAIDSLEAAADAEGEPRRAGGRAAAPAVSARTHTVAEGETFFGIARLYGVTTAQLRAVNPDVDWERLEVGTVLRLPARARVPAQPDRRAGEAGERPAPPSRQAQPAGRRTHTVAQGETLYAIARRYGVTVEALRAANRLEGDRVRVGQTLVIPRAQPR
jgi:peptidoglycan endopeptidase LytF